MIPLYFETPAAAENSRSGESGTHGGGGGRITNDDEAAYKTDSWLRVTWNYNIFEILLMVILFIKKWKVFAVYWWSLCCRLAIVFLDDDLHSVTTAQYGSPHKIYFVGAEILKNVFGVYRCLFATKRVGFKASSWEIGQHVHHGPYSQCGCFPQGIIIRVESLNVSVCYAAVYQVANRYQNLLDLHYLSHWSIRQQWNDDFAWLTFIRPSTLNIAVCHHPIIRTFHPESNLGGKLPPCECWVWYIRQKLNMILLTC